MLNTATLCHLYCDFCKQGTLPTKGTVTGFINLVTNSFFLPAFIAFCCKSGYAFQQFEDWENETFMDGSPDTFFEDVEHAFKMMEE